MDDKDLLRARIRELSHRASSQAFVTHTSFLSLSEQNLFYRILREDHIDPSLGRIGDTPFLLRGGHEESDRKIIFFLPYYMTKEDFIDNHQEEDVITCLQIAPKNPRFADHLTHRDYLGAIMHLGYGRNQYGDILTDGTTGYLFLLKSCAQQMASDITKIRHTVVDSHPIRPSDCPFRPQFIDKVITVSSLRLDALLAESFNLSRRTAQEVIGREDVFVDGVTMMSNAHVLTPGSRVSVRGYGKFIYVGVSHETRRGRLAVTVRIYA